MFLLEVFVVVEVVDFIEENEFLGWFCVFFFLEICILFRDGFLDSELVFRLVFVRISFFLVSRFLVIEFV